MGANGQKKRTIIQWDTKIRLTEKASPQRSIKLERECLRFAHVRYSNLDLTSGEDLLNIEDLPRYNVKIGEISLLELTISDHDGNTTTTKVLRILSVDVVEIISVDSVVIGCVEISFPLRTAIEEASTWIANLPLKNITT